MTESATQKTDPRPIVLAAGGTGGHIFPAEALAEELIARGRKVVLITDKRFADYNNVSDKSALGKIPIYYVHAASPGGNIIKKVWGMACIAIGMMQSRQLLKKLNAEAVVGFGGYPSFPTMMAASYLRLPTTIHEQNSVLGKANRMLTHRMRRIALTYENTQRVAKEAHRKTAVVGNPVRASVCALRNIPYSELQEDAMLNLLVLGGSQGASIFGTVVPEAIKRLPETLRQRIRIDQQCRVEDLDRVRAMYQEMGVSANLSTFFADVASKIANAHLVISRSGASTMAELSVAGRPAILVPLPAATDNHQYYNAQAAEDVGGAWLMPQDGFTSEALAARLESFLTLPGALTKAAAMIQKIGAPNAAQKLADLVLDMAAGVREKNKKPAKEASKTSQADTRSSISEAAA